MHANRWLAAACFTLALGCNGATLMDATPPEPTGTVTGSVRALDGQRIAGASIQLGDRSVTADANGQFLIAGVRADVLHNVYAAADGWSTGHRRAAVSEGASHHVDIVVAPVLEAIIDDAAAGGTVQGADGVQIDFPAGAFVHADGAPVTGPVTVSWSLLNTSESIAAAPGEMKATTGGDEFPLESFGMVEVELSQDGVEVELAADAELSIPLAASSTFEDGETVGLWHFDEELGIWTLEGEGTVNDGVFVAEVPHFSWWNCDQPQATTCLQGTLLTTENQPYQGPVTASGVDYMGTDYTTTGPNGEYVLGVRIASVAALSIEPTYGAAAADWGLEYEVDTKPVATGMTNCTEVGIIILTDLRLDEDEDGVTLGSGDCDDQDPNVFPGNVEQFCDGVDANCDPSDEQGPDADNDGAPFCSDCADDNPAVSPTAADVCDAIPDNNCDGVTDPRESDDDGDGATECEGDCDDTSAEILDQCAYLDVALSATGGCAVEMDSGVTCWGDQFGDGFYEPYGTFTAVAVTETHACGLRVGLGLECWDAFDVWSPVAWGADVVDLFAAGDTVWGLGFDGRLLGEDGAVLDTQAAAAAGGSSGICWTTVFGAVGCSGGPLWSTTPTGIGYSAPVVGQQFACVLDEAGRPVCWGPSGVAGAEPDVVLTELVAGRDHACGLNTAGEAVCWGSDAAGQATPPPGAFTGLVAGPQTTCGVRAAGLMECWGSNAAGQYAPNP